MSVFGKACSGIGAFVGAQTLFEFHRSEDLRQNATRRINEMDLNLQSWSTNLSGTNYQVLINNAKGSLVGRIDVRVAPKKNFDPLTWFGLRQDPFVYLSDEHLDPIVAYISHEASHFWGPFLRHSYFKEWGVDRLITYSQRQSREKGR